MIITKNNHIIKTKNEYLRQSENPELSEEERKRFQTLAIEFVEKIESIVQAKLEKESYKGVKMEEENVAVEKPKFKTIKEHVASVTEQAYKSLLELSNDDFKIAVSLTQNVLGKFREDKKNVKKLSEEPTVEEPENVEDKSEHTD